MPPDLTTAALREHLAAEKAALVATLPEPDAVGPPPAFGVLTGRAWARVLEGVLRGLCSRVPPGVEVVGVGSFGRGAVALGSDLDLRLVARDEDAARAFADELLYPLWDAGVPIGHQVTTPDALLASARDDLPAATGLLDYRHVAGDAAVGEALRRRADEGIFAHSELPVFLARLEREVAERHARFGASVYLLEPDVKNGAGCLRDLDVVRWAAQARFGVAEPDELVRVGALVSREASEIQIATESLWQIRTLLHAHARRRSDRLTFDEQEAISAQLGYGDGGEAIERFMSAYYRTARNVERALDRALVRAAPVLSRRRPRDEDIGDGVRLFDGSVTLGDASLLRADPALALRVAAQAVDRHLPILPFARDAIATACEGPQFCADLRANAEASRRFVGLVATCKDTALRSGSVVRELHDVGLLLAMIPEFAPVVGRVHHDTYHVYTVDVHSVAAVDRLATLVRGELAAEFPLACRLAAEIARPWMLFFATLLHDVGKAIGGTDHSHRGAEMARGILTRLGLSSEEVDDACHLILKHLVMYHVATRRDLDDPATIEEFAREVRGREGLRDLYLLTVADLSTTSPTSMTSWKARMLDELFLATDRALEEASHAGPALGGVPLRVRALAEVERGIPSESLGNLRAFVASMPERYLLSNAPAAVVAHAELAREHAGGVTIALVPSRHPEAAEVCVVADDRPGLLAAITAAMAASRLQVHAAQIHSRHMPDGGVQAVDLFWVRDRAEGAEGVARALPKLTRDVRSILAGEVDASELARRRAVSAPRDRSKAPVATQVSIDPRASQRHTVIEVLARDRPGLLFSISNALYELGLSIAVAKINTEGTRVADVFYVSEADGSRLGPDRSQLVRGRLLEELSVSQHGPGDGAPQVRMEKA